MNPLLDEIVHLTSISLAKAKEMLKITQEITVFIEQEEIQGVNSSLGDRQQLIHQIEDIQGKVHECTKTLQQRYPIKDIGDIDSFRYPQVKTILSHKEQIQNIYTSVYALEAQNQDKARKLMGQYRKQIKNINQGKQAHQAYGRRTPGHSIMIDQFK